MSITADLHIYTAKPGADKSKIEFVKSWHAALLLIDDLTLVIHESETIDRLIAELEKARPWLASTSSVPTTDATDTPPAMTPDCPAQCAAGE